LPRVDHSVEIADHEVLTGGQIIAQKLKHNFVHNARMKNLADKSHHQDDERKEGENGVGSDGEGKCVNFGSHEVFERGDEEVG
jgi:hypothetical protein